MIIDSTYELYPNVTHVIDGVGYDTDGNVVDIDWDAVETRNQELLYTVQRANEYPSIGDQLDALFHAGVFPEDMAATIQAVKDAYPKPE